MSSEVSPSARCRVAQILGASTIALSSSVVREQVRAYSDSVIRRALAGLTREGAAARYGSALVPTYLITAFGRQRYLSERAPPLVNAWKDQRGGWTGARIDELRRLCLEGYPYSKIAAALGGGLSRNACIGKARRIGIPLRKPHDMETDEMRRPRKARTKAKPKTVRREKSFTLSCSGLRPGIDEYAEPPRELPAEAIPLEQRKQVIDLEPNHCRFPYGTPGTADFFFCGGEALSLQPYCPYHCSVAFNGLGRPAPTRTSASERNRFPRATMSNQQSFRAR